MLGIAVVAGVSSACEQDSRAELTTATRSSDVSAAYQVLSETSATEDKVLGDGVVTDLELSQAKERLRRCLIDLGITVEDSETLGAPTDLVSFWSGEDQSLEEGNEACRTDSDAIEAVWLMQNEPTAAEREALTLAFVDCVSALTSSPLGDVDEAVARFRATRPSEDNIAELRSCAAALNRSSVAAFPEMAEAFEEYLNGRE